MRAARALGACLALVLLAVPAAAGCRPDRVEFRTASGLHRYTVEIADTEAEREKGLMGRDHLSAGHGMLFLFRYPTPVSFWMHDTRIPLDMIFVDHAGRVVKVAADTRPMDDTPIPSGARVQAVVELNAGATARAGIRPGTVMRAPGMPQDAAVWTCAAP